MKKYLLPALRVLFLLTILTGIIYPITITFIVQSIFPYKANGSIVTRNGSVVGSELIGQNFTSDKYFHSRPSATDYNPLPSGGSNYGPTSKALQNSMNVNKDQFIEQNQLSSNTIIPSEMLFASASGLDPHISPTATLLQIARIVRARGLDSARVIRVHTLVQQFTESPQWNIFGQERINVLKLNLALDHEFP